MALEFVRLCEVPYEVRVSAAQTLARENDAEKILGLAYDPPFHLGRWIDRERVHPSVRKWLDEVAA